MYIVYMCVHVIYIFIQASSVSSGFVPQSPRLSSPAPHRGPGHTWHILTMWHTYTSSSCHTHGILAHPHHHQVTRSHMAHPHNVAHLHILIMSHTWHTCTSSPSPGHQVTHGTSSQCGTLPHPPHVTHGVHAHPHHHHHHCHTITLSLITLLSLHTS